MKKFKLTFILLLVMLLVGVLAGCGGDSKVTGEFMDINEVIENAMKLSGDSSSEQTYEKTGTPNFAVPEGGYNGSKVEIKFYHTMGQNLRTVLVKYIEKFNQLYPNITVVEEQVGGYDDVRNQISTELTVGGQPNIAYCYPDHVALYNIPGAVVNLDNLMDSTIEVARADGTTEVLGLTAEQRADFIEGYYNEGRQFGDGLMYTMPFSKSTEVLYYNETFFTEHNIELPDHWFSTSESDTKSMEYVCKKIKEIDPESIPLGYDSEANWFITMCEQCGSEYTSATGSHYRFNNETNKAVVNQFRQWYQKGWMTTQTIYGAYTSGLFVAETSPRSYMSIGSSAGATHQRPSKVTIEDDEGNEKSVYPFNVGITSIPQMNPNRPKVISQGPSVCIFNNAGGSSITDQQIVASWLLVKYLTTSVEFQAEFSMASGYVPVLKSVATNPVYQAFTAKANGGDNIAALSAKVCLEQENAYYTSPAFNGSSTARDQVGFLLSKVLSSQTDNVYGMITEAFEDAIDECEY